MKKIDHLIKLFCTQGTRRAIENSAPTQRVNSTLRQDLENENRDGYTAKAKASRLDRWLDTVVKISGYEFVFLSIMAALLAWALLGIKFGDSENWQVAISDVQAIFTYFFDSFAMRQQLNSYGSLLEVTACLKSRDARTKRMLRKIIDADQVGKILSPKLEEMDQSEFAIDLPPEN